MKRKTRKDQSGGIEADILDNALVMITVLDKKGTILAWNRAAETITGYTRDNVIGSTAVWRQLYPEKEYRSTITKKIGHILSSRNYFENLETIIRTRSGDTRIILWNTKEIAGDAESRVIAVGIDVTGQREADVFRDSIIDNANVIITVLDPQGNVLVWNKAAESVTGYSHDEVINSRAVWKRLYPDAKYRQTVTRRISDIITKHRYFENLETTILTKSGDQRIISWNTRETGSGAEAREIAIGRDITEQRRAEAFRESVIENANVLITVLDSSGNVLAWNQAAESVTGYLRQEVIGSGDVWKRLYPDKDYRRTITKRITDIIAARQYFENLETTIVTKSGDQKIISWNTRQIGGAGRENQSIAIGRDITEQRKAEEALIAYITEMAMRIKQPVEIIGDNLRDVVQLIRQEKLTPDEVAIILEGQVRNVNQIAANIQEFQKAIVEKQKEIPDAYRDFLKG